MPNTADADHLASAMWAFAQLVGEADGEFHPQEIKAASDWLRAGAFSAHTLLLRDAALVAARDYGAILAGLTGRTALEIFDAAREVISPLGVEEKENVYLDFLLFGHAIAEAHGGGFGRDPAAPTERKIITFLIDYMGGNRDDITRAVARIPG